MARECVDADYATHAAAADFRDECVRDTERDIIDIQASSNGHSETKRVMELGLGLGPISWPQPESYNPSTTRIS